VTASLADLLEAMGTGRARPTQGACLAAAARIRELEAAQRLPPGGGKRLEPSAACSRCGAAAEVIARETEGFGSHLCERASMRAWHTEACARQLEDPGASCTCRPPRGDDISIDFNRSSP